MKHILASLKLSDHENYILWRYKIKIVLVRKRLWKHVDGSTIASTMTSGSSKVVSIVLTTSQSVDDNNKRYEATSITINNLKERMLLNVIHLVDPKEIWNSLRNLCEFGNIAC